jgi:hypothetical protein
MVCCGSQTIVQNDTYGPPINVTPIAPAVVSSLTGWQAEIWIRDTVGNLAAWFGTSGRTTPDPAPAVVGAITNPAPTTLPLAMQVTPVAFSVQPGAYTGQAHVWDAGGNRTSNPDEWWAINVVADRSLS